MGVWHFGIPHVHPGRFQEFEKIRSLKYDEITRLAIPRCKVQPHAFEIENRETVVITNVSCVPVKWKVVQKPDIAVITPDRGMLGPSMSANVTVELSERVTDVQTAMLEIEGGAAVSFQFWSKSDAT
jgi:hypothetical protein